ncbi:MAG: acyl-CoA dehydrogenase family protein [Alphaproteobacteria bacterium]|nr:acyl-CoA dehydrogenase family protein [Alphaproteobacteria bacterium]
MDTLIPNPIDPVARARDLAPAIAAAADAIEDGRCLPKPLVEQLHEARLFRMFYPRSVGGDEVAPGAYVRALEELGKADGSVAWCVSIANSTGLIAAYLEPEIAQTIFGDTRATVAWGPPNQSSAAAAPGGYRVTGRWDFASGSRHAKWLGAHGPVIEPDGSFRLNHLGRPAIRTWLFPAESATLLDNWSPIGLRGTASESYTVTDLFVPEAFSATREDPTLRREPGRLYAFPQQTLYSVGIAGVALGIARGMLDAFIDLACHKTPRGMARLADSPTIQAEVARCEARLGAARAYMIDTVGEIYQGADSVAPIGVPERARVRLAAAYLISNAVAVADYTYKTAGVDAIFPGSPFERRFRDIHTVSQQIQSRDVHYESCGQVLLGNPPAVFL